MLWVFEPELDAIAGLGASIHLTFFGITMGGAVTLGATLYSVDIADPLRLAVFWASFITCAVLAVYFGVRGYGDYQNGKAKLKEIKEGRQKAA